MNFEQLQKISPKWTPPKESYEDEINEAFESLGDGAKFTRLVINGTPRVIFRRCRQCTYFSASLRCPVCKNNPVMLPVDFLKIQEQMEGVGRVCMAYASTSCIQTVACKTDWCEDCTKFWDTEFYHTKNIFKQPMEVEGLNPALKPKVEEIDDEKEDWEEECEDLLDMNDMACSLLWQIKQYFDFLADPNMITALEPDDRKEMKNYIQAIDEICEKCGFDGEEEKVEVEDPNEAFNERDKELLDRMSDDGSWEK